MGNSPPEPEVQTKGGGPARFLTAFWSHLCLVTYEVPPDLLRARLPDGLEPDLKDGRAFASLVCFDFLRTRVLGVGWPGFRDFPEINLRFYVRRADGIRGVMFERELVPSRLVAWIARTLYNEPYRAARMRSEVVAEADGGVRVRHDWTDGGRDHRLTVVGRGAPTFPPEDSTEHFFKEHQWGFGRDRAGRPLRYEVRHPHWRVWEVGELDLDVGFEALYGPDWAFLDGAEPCSVVLAEGSEIEVFGKSTEVSPVS